MSKYMTIFSFLFAFILFGCSSNNDIYVTTDIGNITRGEFHEWLEMNHFTVKSIQKSKIQMNEKLTMMTLEMLAVREAESSGFTREEPVKAYIDIMRNGLLARDYFENEILPQSKIKQKIVRVQHILFKNVPGRKAANYENPHIARALAELAKGTSFAEVAKKYSDDVSRNNGGEIGFITRDMMPKEYTDMAFSLRKNEYSKTPVNLSNGLYIIRVVDIKEVTFSDSSSYSDNKMLVSRLSTSLSTNIMNEYISQLQKMCTFNESAVSSTRPQDVIFSTPYMVFTTANFNAVYDFLCAQKRHANNEERARYIAKKPAFARDIFRVTLIAHEARLHKYDMRSSFIKKEKAITRAAIAKEYLKHVSRETTPISEQLCRAEYERYKNSRYATTIKLGNRIARTPRPYSEVRDAIAASLDEQDRAGQFDKRNKALLKNHRVEIKIH